jgi:uncharacterized protein with PIN domain
MLGKLAKWLRIIGYDTRYDSSWADEDLISQARHDGRFVLTRDRILAARLTKDQGLFVKSQAPREQFRQVVEGLMLDTERNIFTICTVCNTRVAGIAKEKVVRSVPEYIHEHHEAYLECPACGRIYWQGSHFVKVRRWIAEALGKGNGNSERTGRRTEQT